MNTTTDRLRAMDSWPDDVVEELLALVDAAYATTRSQNTTTIGTLLSRTLGRLESRVEATENSVNPQ
jgi:hypothetical protein